MKFGLSCGGIPRWRGGVRASAADLGGQWVVSLFGGGSRVRVRGASHFTRGRPASRKDFIRLKINSDYLVPNLEAASLDSAARSRLAGLGSSARTSA